MDTDNYSRLNSACDFSEWRFRSLELELYSETDDSEFAADDKYLNITFPRFMLFIARLTSLMTQVLSTNRPSNHSHNPLISAPLVITLSDPDQTNRNHLICSTGLIDYPS